MTPENERDAQATGDEASGEESPVNAPGSNAAASEPLTSADSEVPTGAETDSSSSDFAGGEADPSVIDMASVVAGLGNRGENAVAEADDSGKGTDSGDAGADAEGVAPDGEGELSLEEQLAASEAQVAAHWDRLVRLQAEMENQRKRAQRDVSNARKFALEGIAGDLLPVKDSLELGIQAASAEEASLANLLEGSELTLKMLAQVLEKHAIAEVNPEGEKFDPEFHQAMSMQEAEGVAPNTVTGVMQKGYTLNDRLIRPALVMVSK